MAIGQLYSLSTDRRQKSMYAVANQTRSVEWLHHHSSQMWDANSWPHDPASKVRTPDMFKYLLKQETCKDKGYWMPEYYFRVGISEGR